MEGWLLMGHFTLVVYCTLRLSKKVYPKEEIEGKFAQTWDYHLIRTKKEF
jgi:hypothetical protein